MELIEFAKKYKYLNVPGTKDFKLYDLLPFEEEYLKNLLNHKLLLVKQSRQMHVTSLYIVYVSWFLLYNTKPETNIVVAVRNNESSGDFKLKVDTILIYHGLRDVYVLKSIKKNIGLSNGNNFHIFPLSYDTFRGKGNLHTVIFDNIVPNDYMIDLFKQLKNGCCKKIIFSSSTPYDNSGFEQLYYSKEKDDWCRLVLHYSTNPLLCDEMVKELKKNYNLFDWNTQMELKPVTSNHSANKNNTLQIRIDDTLMMAVGLKLIEKDINISQYIRTLIEADVKLI